ncbi:MAG: ATP-binding protein, partial [Alphaproteobacteria bacterium]
STNPPDRPPAPQNASFELDREQLHRSLLSAVSHDLKTPLACIIGSLEIYERSKDQLPPDKQNILINTALQEAYRLDSLLTSILEMARLESGAVQVNKQPYDMELLLQDCQAMLGHRLSGCDIRIRPVSGAFPITTDPVLLARAICLILDNSARHGQAHPVINVAYERSGDQVLIRIQDNGPGVPESRLEAIFAKYARFAPLGGAHSGIGLGLPICREIMALLGGAVMAAIPANGAGAVFTLSFPA